MKVRKQEVDEESVLTMKINKQNHKILKRQQYT